MKLEQIGVKGVRGEQWGEEDDEKATRAGIM